MSRRYTSTGNLSPSFRTCWALDSGVSFTCFPNSSEIGVRVVEEVSGAVVEVMLDTDIPAATQLLSPRNYMNNSAPAAAVAYDCSGVYVETDY